MASRQDAASHSSRRLAGRSIGAFSIDKEIGKGSFAQVYMGWHKVRYTQLYATLLPPYTWPLFALSCPPMDALYGRPSVHGHQAYVSLLFASHRPGLSNGDDF